MLGWDTIPAGYVTTAACGSASFRASGSGSTRCGEHVWGAGGLGGELPGGMVRRLGRHPALLEHDGGRDWSKADDLAIFYSGKNYARGAKSYPGAFAGLRMKIMRRAQQDIGVPPTPQSGRRLDARHSTAGPCT